METVCRETTLCCPIAAANIGFAQLFERNTSFLFFYTVEKEDKVHLTRTNSKLLSVSESDSTFFKVEANFCREMLQKNNQSSVVPLKGIKWRVKGRIIGLFFLAPSVLMSAQIIPLWFGLHLQIGCNNQQPSHSGALILQRLSIVALPSAASACLGLEWLIGSDVLSFPFKLICWRHARLPSSSCFRSAVQWRVDMFESTSRKDYQFPACAWGFHRGRHKWTCWRWGALSPVMMRACFNRQLWLTEYCWS